MSKVICVSFPEYIFHKYFENYNGNRSKFIEEMFIRGLEAETGSESEYKIKYIELTKELRSKDIEINKLKLDNAKIKSQIKTREQKEQEYQEEQLKEAIFEGMKNQDFWKQ